MMNISVNYVLGHSEGHTCVLGLDEIRTTRMKQGGSKHDFTKFHLLL